jgi:hypothetical protein
MPNDMSGLHHHQRMRETPTIFECIAADDEQIRTAAFLKFWKPMPLAYRSSPAIPRIASGAAPPALRELAEPPANIYHAGATFP